MLPLLRLEYTVRYHRKRSSTGLFEGERHPWVRYEVGHALFDKLDFRMSGREEDVADQFAAEGYLAIAPALFDRQERGVNLAYDDAGVEPGHVQHGVERLPQLAHQPAELGQQPVPVVGGQTAGQAGEPGQVGAPWIELAAGDLRLGRMVDHDRQRQMFARESTQCRQVARQHVVGAGPHCREFGVGQRHLTDLVRPKLTFTISYD